jgi:hypothetical protein
VGRQKASQEASSEKRAIAEGLGGKLDKGPPKRGRPKRYSDNNAGDDLATAYRWAIQRLLEKKSFRQIEKESGVSFNTVRDQIHSLVKKLPDPYWRTDFQSTVRALLAASGSPVKDSEI